MNKLFDTLWKRLFVPQSFDSHMLYQSQYDLEKEKYLLRQKYTRWIHRRFLYFNVTLIAEKSLTTKEIRVKISHWIPYLCDQGSINEVNQLLHTWSNSARSLNIKIKESDPFTFHRNPVANSTDSIRGRKGYSNGVHIWKIHWPQTMRGTHAVIGVATDKSLLQIDGYTSLVGYDNESWGWDIVSCKKVHARHIANPINFEKYPNNNKLNGKMSKIPETIYVVLDMFQGTLSYIASNKFLGVAHKGLLGKTLYPTVSAVWGHSEVSLRYFNKISDEPPSLRNLCIYQFKRLLTFHCLYNETVGRQCQYRTISDINPLEDYEQVVNSRNIPRVIKLDLLKKGSLAVNF